MTRNEIAGGYGLLYNDQSQLGVTPTFVQIITGTFPEHYFFEGISIIIDLRRCSATIEITSLAERYLDKNPRQACATLQYLLSRLIHPSIFY